MSSVIERSCNTYTVRAGIIGLIGPAGSGKTTLASIIESYIPTAIRLKLADPLAEAASALGINRDTHPVLWRKLMQTMGEPIREAEPDYFVDRLINHIYTLMEYHGENGRRRTLFVIDDVRFPNEVLRLREVGAALYFLDPGDRLHDLVDPTNRPAFRYHESEALSNALYDHAHYRCPAPTPEEIFIDEVRSMSTVAATGKNPHVPIFLAEVDELVAKIRNEKNVLNL